MTQAPEFPHDRLRDEVRLLGALLGEVIRDEGGQDLYDRIEAVRRASVAYHRDPASDDASELERLLGELSLDQAIGLTHGFAAFSLLANVAEDRAGKRRAQAQAEAGERADTPEGVLKRLAEAGADRNAVRDLLAQALISPVLTAHPSEVRRKSVIDRTTAVGELLDGCDRDGIACDAETLKAALRRQIVILWATRLTRASALVVQDEIDTVVDWLQRIFLHVAPAQLAEWRRLLDAPDLTPFVRIGSWVGGDRDGNPNVDADTLRAAFRSQARAALGFYLDEVHALGAELSLSIDLTRVTPELAALAQGSGDASIQRADEPYRRALSQIYARLSAAHPALTGEPTPRPARFDAPAYDGPDAFRADLNILHDSLVRTHGAVFADDRLARLITAADVFGFHMATLDLRQNSDVHQRVVADLLKVAGVCPDYAALDEAERLAVLARELASPRPLFSPYADYAAETLKERAILQAAAEALSTFGPQAIRTHIVSKTDAASDMLEVYLLLKEVGLYDPADPGACPIQAAPVRDHRRPARRPRHAGARPGRAFRPRRGRGARGAGGDDRLFGLEQGRLLPDLGVGAARGLARPAGGHARGGGAAAAVPRPGRRCRARRRLRLLSGAGPARRHRRGPHPRHRTGRGHRQQIRRAGSGPTQPRRPDLRNPAGLAGAAVRRGLQRRARGRGRAPVGRLDEGLSGPRL